MNEYSWLVIGLKFSTFESLTKNKIIHWMYYNSASPHSSIQKQLFEAKTYEKSNLFVQAV